MNDEFESGYNPNSEFVDGVDLEDDEDLASDYHEELGQFDDSPGPGPQSMRGIGPPLSRPRSPAAPPPTAPGNRIAKIKPMSAKILKAFPGVSTILITRQDGRQVLFVRR